MAFTASRSLAVLLALALAQCCSSASMVYRDQEAGKPLVRTHAHAENHRTMQLSSGGQVKAVDAGHHKSHNEDFCNVTFGLGKVHSNECHHGFQPVNYKEMCEWVSETSGIPMKQGGSSEFIIPEAVRDDYPHGCGLAKGKICYPVDHPEAEIDHSHRCIIFNEIGDMPTHPRGFPLCYRNRYVNGHVTENVAECPHDYSVIETNRTCGLAGACLDVERGDPFVKAEHNEHEFNHFPAGCFTEHELVYQNGGSTTQHVRKVFFNQPRHGSTPSDVQHGVPVCMISEPLLASNTPAAGDWPADPPRAPRPHNPGVQR